jgi:CheY-like chemotaxis protein
VRILLVEDEPDAARMLAKGLREESYAVDVVGDGESACYQAQIADYDAIVLDVLLPRQDGLTVCRSLRRDGQSVPILMLTARDAVEARIAGLDSGADDYLTKRSTSASCWRGCGRSCADPRGQCCPSGCAWPAWSSTRAPIACSRTAARSRSPRGSTLSSST